MASVSVPRLPPLPSVRDIVRIYKLQAQHQLSQNFLLDVKLCNKIVLAAGKISEGYVCEVGPGPGGLTRSIINSGVKLLCVVEKDKRFLPGLELINQCSKYRMNIINSDILHEDLSNVFPEHMKEDWSGPCPNLHLIGNLPFNISTQLLIKWLEMVSNQSGPFKLGRIKMTLTFQKEVAQRMTAPAFDVQRSRLSVMCQYLCHTKLKFIIQGKHFVPKPEVDAAVVTLEPRVNPLIEVPFKSVEKVVAAIFHFRQKYCKKGIVTLFPDDMPELTTEMFDKTEIDPTTRTFNLTLQDFEKLCVVYEDICKRIPGIRRFNYRLPKY